MVAVLRSRDLVPPPRWIRNVTPPPESLGQALLRLRKARDLEQVDIARLLGVGKTTISNYENDKYPPSREALLVLDAYFDLAPNTLRRILREYQEWFDSQEPLPGPSIAIPDEPGLRQAVERLFALEPEQFPRAVDGITLLVEEIVGIEGGMEEKGAG